MRNHDVFFAGKKVKNVQSCYAHSMYIIYFGGTERIIRILYFLYFLKTGSIYIYALKTIILHTIGIGYTV